MHSKRSLQRKCNAVSQMIHGLAGRSDQQLFLRGRKRACEGGCRGQAPTAIRGYENPNHACPVNAVSDLARLPSAQQGPIRLHATSQTSLTNPKLQPNCSLSPHSVVISYISFESGANDVINWVPCALMPRPARTYASAETTRR